MTNVSTILVVGALDSDKAVHKALEPAAENGAVPAEMSRSLAALDANVPGSRNGVDDRITLPESEHPAHVFADLKSVRARWA